MIAITIYIDDTSADLICQYANSAGKSTSEYIRDTVLNHIEDQEDLKMLHAAIENDDGVRFSRTEVLQDLAF